jgi:hypothetical protein
MAKESKPLSADDSSIRHTVARGVLYTSIGGVILLSATTIGLSFWSKDVLDAAKFVFGSVLPLLGAWVGTLLAYYFSRENFEAATKSVTEMAREVGAMEKLRAIPVREKMRPLKDITFSAIKKGEENKCKLPDLLTKFERLDRIPLLDDANCIVYLLYKHMIHRFLTQMVLDPAKLQNKKVGDLTLRDLIDSDSDLQELLQNSFGFVPETATLADAKREMEAVSKKLPCNDVFVTQGGKPDQPVIGWITDNKIAEHLKV